jgi:hypothetical protein
MDTGAPLKEIMKTILLENILSENELSFIYNEIIHTTSWSVTGKPADINYQSNKNFLGGPQLIVKGRDQNIYNYALYMLGKTFIYRIENMLKDKNIGIHTKMIRMWFNITYYGKETQHWLHTDHDETDKQSIVIFMTPFWKNDWNGSFYVDGEKFPFKPGSAVIFDSKEYHTGESPTSETFNWQRLTCNIVMEK